MTSHGLTICPVESPPLRQHKVILARLLKEAGYSHASAAKAIGYSSGSAVGMMLRGERGLGMEDLKKLCDLAGVSVVTLASMSDDLMLTTSPETAEIARELDGMTPEQRAAVRQMIAAIKGR